MMLSMYKLNSVGDSGHPFLTPWFIEIFYHLFLLLLRLLFEFHGITFVLLLSGVAGSPFNHNAPEFIVICYIEDLFIVNKSKEDWDIIYFSFFQ
jgi:hypothetical protein